MTSRRSAKYSYPQSRATLSLPFKRNFAQGPAADQPVTAVIGSPPPNKVGWATIQDGTPPGTNVPVTPSVTGVFLVQGVVEVLNTTESLQILSVQLGSNGTVSAKPNSLATVPAAGGSTVTTVPIQALLGPFPLGVPVDIQLFVSAQVTDTLTLQANNTTLSVQEVQNPL
jgi:hypothetical protein